jgi:mannose-6-phosphate isomerase-like protein (cupin superfamily)
MKFTLHQTLEQLKAQNKNYLEFLREPSMSVGVYHLPVGHQDTQQPHTEDELYFVIKGKGGFYLDGEDLYISEGTSLFVPANTPHRFHSIVEDLTVLVVFSPPEYTRQK